MSPPLLQACQGPHRAGEAQWLHLPNKAQSACAQGGQQRRLNLGSPQAVAVPLDGLSHHLTYKLISYK